MRLEYGPPPLLARIKSTLAVHCTHQHHFSTILVQPMFHAFVTAAWWLSLLRSQCHEERSSVFNTETTPLRITKPDKKIFENGFLNVGAKSARWRNSIIERFITSIHDKDIQRFLASKIVSSQGTIKKSSLCPLIILTLLREIMALEETLVVSTICGFLDLVLLTLVPAGSFWAL